MNRIRQTGQGEMARDTDDEEANLLALLSGMDDEKKKEEESLQAAIEGITESHQDEASQLEAQLLLMSTTGGEDDETAKLEKMLAGMSDGGGDDDLEQMINALSSDEEGEESVEDLRQRVREAKLEALKYKRAGNIDKAKEALRRSKDLQSKLDQKQQQLQLQNTGELNVNVQVETEKKKYTSDEYKQLAVQMRREGKMDLARKYLRLSKQQVVMDSNIDVDVNAAREVAKPALAIPTEGLGDDEGEHADQAKLKELVLEHKRHALRLKREGRIPEAKQALRKAKEVQAQLDAIS